MYELLYSSPDGDIRLTQTPAGYTILCRGSLGQIETVAVLPEFWEALAAARKLCGMNTYNIREETA